LGLFALPICQPFFLAAILLGSFLGLNFDEGPAWPAVFLASNLLYFVAFFYPVYSMVVMDRAVEVVRYRRMKTIMILFGSVHLLLGLALVFISRL
jgi:vacuolar-type H+-ATPase subunit I/STV1